jgi:signal transduction histidine kinase
VLRDRARRAVNELWQLVGGGMAAPAGAVLAGLTAASAALTAVGGLGIPLLTTVVGLTRRLVDAHRRWAGAVLGTPIPSPYQPMPPRRLARWRAVAADKATWRDFAWLLANFPVSLGGMVIGVALWGGAAQCALAPLLRAVLPPEVVFDPLVIKVTNQPRAWLMVLLSPAVIAAAYLLPRWLIIARARLARWLLAPTAADLLSRRVGELTATRAEALDTAAVELRRIERDLHDGPQARLVSLAMNLGVAEDVVEDDPAAAKTMLAQARDSARATLDELRDLVRGIHPPVLADRGLAGAVRALALTSPIPVEVRLRLERRLAAPVESAAYFVVAEALANAIRHSGAGRIRISIHDDVTALRLIVWDDGRGGADPDGGTGLRGIQRRLAAFDGVLDIVSPPRGPTVLSVELPCGS